MTHSVLGFARESQQPVKPERLASLARAFGGYFSQEDNVASELDDAASGMPELYAWFEERDPAWGGFLLRVLNATHSNEHSRLFSPNEAAAYHFSAAIAGNVAEAARSAAPAARPALRRFLEALHAGRVSDMQLALSFAPMGFADEHFVDSFRRELLLGRLVDLPGGRLAILARPEAAADFTVLLMMSQAAHAGVLPGGVDGIVQNFRSRVLATVEPTADGEWLVSSSPFTLISQITTQ